MTASAGCDRRAFLSRWRGCGLDRCQAPSPAAARPASELVVARRAMACEFSLRVPAGRRHAIDAACAALDEVERIESKLSAYLETSDLARWNRRAGESAVVDAEVYGLLRWAARLSVSTGGAFDAASGALVRAWGFFRGPTRVPSEPERIAALAASGSSHLVFDDAERSVRARPGVEFNLGGMGKGYAVDRALALVRGRFGINRALMQGGQSSLKGMGAPPGEARGWPVDLADPVRPGRRFAVVWLRNQALGTSAADHLFFVDRGRRFGHILDPRTGRPARGILSASALAASAAEADALSTAFFVMGAEETRRFCERHPAYGAVLLLPAKRRGAAPEVLVLGAADVEVTL